MDGTFIGEASHKNNIIVHCRLKYCADADSLGSEVMKTFVGAASTSFRARERNGPKEPEQGTTARRDRGSTFATAGCATVFRRSGRCPTDASEAAHGAARRSSSLDQVTKLFNTPSLQAMTELTLRRKLLTSSASSSRELRTIYTRVLQRDLGTRFSRSRVTLAAKVTTSKGRTHMRT